MGSFVVVCTPDRVPDARVAERALRAAPHRGEPRASARIGDALVAIADAEAPATDASIAEADGHVAAFTGELDNRGPLAVALGLAPDASTARVAIAAHLRWGADAPRRYRGPFAVAITDGRAVHLARDVLGLRSVFYRRDAAGTFAASEVTQVLTRRRRPDRAGPRRGRVDRVRRVRRRYADRDRRRRAGSPRDDRSIREASSAARHRYWDPREILETGRYEASELPERFDELMGRAAARSLLGDDVLSLSGGTDSSAVAAYAAPAHLDRFGRPLAALSVVYPRLPAVDEREEIELVAGRARDRAAYVRGVGRRRSTRSTLDACAGRAAARSSSSPSRRSISDGPTRWAIGTCSRERWPNGSSSAGAT